jgi:hypothetical protein
MDIELQKQDVTVDIIQTREGSYELVVNLKTGRIFQFPLVWMVFGSKTSVDCDVIIFVSSEFVQSQPRPDICNKMCEILNPFLEQIIGKAGANEKTETKIKETKEINCSIGYWHEGEIKWAQKGSDLGEVNNSIMATFNNHPSLQMISCCPLTVTLKRDVWYKIQTTIRDILCKMNKSRYHDDPLGICITRMQSLIVNILAIPEIMAYSKNDKKKYVCPILQGVFIQKIAGDELYNIIPSCGNLINRITATAENKRKKLKLIDNVVDLMEKKLDTSDAVLKILKRNRKDGDLVLQLIANLDSKSRTVHIEQYDRLKKILTDLIESGVIHLNRIIRIVRHIQPLGVRIDCLRLLDLSIVRYLLPKEGVLTRYKDIAFKFGQAYALMDGKELYDKTEIATYYETIWPTLGIFLRREDSTVNDLISLNNFIRLFLDRVESYSGFSRDLCEQYRNQ